MKTYIGHQNPSRQGGQRILVWENDSCHLLKHIARHSPDGFNWGYGGSGPADTALSILTDCLGSDQADQLYQAFKWRFVSRWGEHFRITEKEIRQWVRATQAKQNSPGARGKSHTRGSRPKQTLGGTL